MPRITFNKAKRAQCLAERGLDFKDAKHVFAGEVYTYEDVRKDYGETRFSTFGHLEGRMVFVGWTPRGKARRVFTMRYANDREREKYVPYFDVD